MGNQARQAHQEDVPTSGTTRRTSFYAAIRAVAVPPEDAFWGVRTGEVLDASGHRWAFDQRVREVPVEEIEAELAGMFDGA